MALEKIELVDRIEIAENGSVQVRTATRILEDGVAISGTFHRHAINPGDVYSEEDDRVKAICQIIHTQAVISAYKATLDNATI